MISISSDAAQASEQQTSKKHQASSKQQATSEHLLTWTPDSCAQWPEYLYWPRWSICVRRAENNNNSNNCQLVKRERAGKREKKESRNLGVIPLWPFALACCLLLLSVARSLAHLFTCSSVYLLTCSPVHLHICSPVHLFNCLACAVM